MSTQLGNKEIMAKNIRHYMDLHGKSRNDMCEALAVKYTTFTDWVNGNTYPRIDSIELMANYFGIEKSDLVEERSHEEQNQYYLNEEAGELAKEMFERPELKVLFDASRNVTKEDILSVANILEKLKTYEDGDM